MPSCQVVGCKNGYGDGESNLQTFCIKSKNSKYSKTCLFNKWLEKLNINSSPKHLFVCERHFSEDAFVPEADNLTTRGQKRKKKQLKPMAVPTLHLRPPGFRAYSLKCEQCLYAVFQNENALNKHIDQFHKKVRGACPA